MNTPSAKMTRGERLNQRQNYDIPDSRDEFREDSDAGRVRGAGKRTREEGLGDAAESTDGSRGGPTSAQALPPPSKRTFHDANAVASGSSSRDIPATQYDARNEDSNVEAVSMRKSGDLEAVDGKVRHGSSNPPRKRRSEFGLRFADEEEAGYEVSEQARIAGWNASHSTGTAHSQAATQPFSPIPSATSGTPAPLPITVTTVATLSSLSRLFDGLGSAPATWIEQLAGLITVIHPRLVSSATAYAQSFDQAGIINPEQFVQLVSSLRNDSVDRPTAMRIARIVGDEKVTGGMSEADFELFVEGVGRFAAE